jgi:excisionase family DNA binding protein
MTRNDILKKTKLTSEQRRLYSMEQVALILGLSRTKVYQLVRSGDLVSVKIGKRRMVFRESIDEYVERLRVEAGIA